MLHLPVVWTFVLLLSALAGGAQCVSGFFGPEDGSLTHHGLEKVSGGGFVTFGVKASGPHGNDDWFLSYYDTEYALQWSRAIGTSYREQGTNLVCREVPGLGFVLAGYYKVSGGSPREWLCTMVDYGGSIVWAKTVPSVGFGIGETPRDCLVLEDRIVLVGTTNSYGSGDSDAVIICLDFQGNMLWGKVMGGVENDHFYGIILNHEGFLVIAGNNQSYDYQYHHNWVLKVDLEGNVLNEYIYEADFTDTAFDIYQSDDLSYWITGETASYGDLSKNIQIFRLNENFQIMEQHVFLQSGIDGGVSIAGEGSPTILLATHHLQNDKTLSLLSVDDLSAFDIPVITPNPGVNYFTPNFAPQSLIIDNGVAIIAGNTSEMGITYAQLCYVNFGGCMDNESTCAENNLLPRSDATFSRADYSSFKEEFDLIEDFSVGVDDLLLGSITDCISNPCQLEVYPGDTTISLCLGDTVSLSPEVVNNGPFEMHWVTNNDTISQNSDYLFHAGTSGNSQVDLTVTTEIEGCTYSISYLLSVSDFAVCELDSALTLCSDADVFIELPFCNSDSILTTSLQEMGTYAFVLMEGCSVSIINLELTITGEWPLLSMDNQSICSNDSVFIPVEPGEIHVVNGIPFNDNYSLVYGSYTLDYANAGCEYSIEFEIVNPDFSFHIPDTFACSLPITLDLDCENCNWDIPELVGEGSSTIHTPGIYNFMAWNACDTISGSFSVASIAAPEPVWEIICPGDSIVLQVPAASQSFIENGLEEIEFLADSAGRFFYHVLDSVSGCILSLALDVEFYRDYDFEDTTICAEDFQGINLMFEDVPDGYSVSTITLSDSFMYYFEHEVCSLYNDSVHVVTMPCTECDIDAIYLPNSITYNNDGLNDYFQPDILCPLASFELSIFNRWGELIFHTTNPVDHWPLYPDNDQIPIDVYVWVLNVRFPNEPYHRLLKGHVALLK